MSPAPYADAHAFTDLDKQGRDLVIAGPARPA